MTDASAEDRAQKEEPVTPEETLRRADEAELLSTTDAAVWARHFIRRFGEARSAPAIDEGLMLAWFANAIEVGRDAGRAEERAGREQERALHIADLEKLTAAVAHANEQRERAGQAEALGARIAVECWRDFAGGPDLCVFCAGRRPTHEAGCVLVSVAPARLAAEWATVDAVIDEQARDDGLWFLAPTAPEAYLQRALRRLHAAVEAARRGR